MRDLEFYLSLKLLLEIAGILLSIALGSIDFILMFSIMLLIDTAFWIKAKKVLKAWDKPAPRK